MLSIKAGDDGVQTRRKDRYPQTSEDSIRGWCRRLILSYLSVGDRPQGLGGPFGGHLGLWGDVVEPFEANRGRFGRMIFPMRKARLDQFSFQQRRGSAATKQGRKSMMSNRLE